jgi:hypothetical protein
MAVKMRRNFTKRRRHKKAKRNNHEALLASYTALSPPPLALCHVITLDLDVIIVVPSPTKGHCNGVIASSDFYVTFPSSVQSNVSTGLNSSSAGARLQRWTSSFLFNTTSSRLVNVSDDSPTLESPDSVEHVGAECTGPSEKQLPPQLECPQRGNVTIQINGRNVPELEMNFRTFKNGESTSESQSKFVNGNGYRPPTETLEMLVGEAILNYGRNLIRYILFNDQHERIGAVV